MQGGVGVCGGNQLSPRQAQTGKEHGKEVLGELGQLVAVSPLQGHAPNLALAPGVVGSFQKDPPPKQIPLFGLNGKGEVALAHQFLQQQQAVAL